MNTRGRAGANTPSHAIDISEKAGVRYLHFGSSWVQGAMRLRQPWALELAYTREMLAGLLLHEAPWPRRVLQVGLGAGSLTRFLWRHCPATQLTVVEINPRVEIAARQFFELPDDPARLQVVIADGADFLLQSAARQAATWDYLLVDGFDHQARAGMLDTLPFYLACRARMADPGLLAVNLFGRSKGFAASVERLREAFDGRVVVFPSCDSGNAIALAATGATQQARLSELRQRAQQLKTDTGLDLAPTLTRLEAAGQLFGERLLL